MSARVCDCARGRVSLTSLRCSCAEYGPPSQTGRTRMRAQALLWRQRRRPRSNGRSSRTRTSGQSRAGSGGGGGGGGMRETSMCSYSCSGFDSERLIRRPALPTRGQNGVRKAGLHARTDSMRESDPFRVVQSSDGAQERRLLECGWWFMPAHCSRKNRHVPDPAGGMVVSAREAPDISDRASSGVGERTRGAAYKL